MDLKSESEAFKNEEICRAKFKAYRDAKGVTCPKCGCEEHYWKSDKSQYECKKCKTRVTLRSGTLMHGSKLPFKYWFTAMHLLSSKEKLSAKDIQRQLGHNRYQSILEMMQKLRFAMANSNQSLVGKAKFEEVFFSTIIKDKEDQPSPIIYNQHLRISDYTSLICEL